ncbi:hypothetical protein BAUCODRAFT_191220 [Baudoinia panamericana UAMH 10762]|uniref:Uncharacterized protein n=1 Tax=Baudoinia panamericana (strain UAMH 10762) TaxID=717646 RepID=M2M1R4_BAUPA|nr:uncharacterized protein BAUCODRAFT_191220 [Baudoinia panamericana UAMH 10762]EMD00988.1 hypothetical protein BAUCODRAFT_191220 [Baudoinia panamericana UAMH 10762]
MPKCTYHSACWTRSSLRAAMSADARSWQLAGDARYVADHTAPDSAASIHHRRRLPSASLVCDFPPTASRRHAFRLRAHAAESPHRTLRLLRLEHRRLHPFQTWPCHE